MTDGQLAERYQKAVSAAEQSAIAAEPEAQLTVPVKDLFEAVGSGPKGLLTLIREAQLVGVRPDFGALYNGYPCGWVELKAPHKSTDGSKWRGREAKQWKLLAELDSLIVCNGTRAQLYSTGRPVGDAVQLPLVESSQWTSAPLGVLLTNFVAARPEVIKTVSQLASRLAPLARLLRDRIRIILVTAGDSSMHRGMKTWAAHVHKGVDEAGFANDLSQVISYSMAIAALRGGADLNQDKHIALNEARQAIEKTSPVLSAALGPVLGVKGLLDEIRHEVAAIERLASAVDTMALATSKDPRGEPWLWFYEDFLQVFDPNARKRAGVYYTPTDIVHSQVRAVEDVLRLRFKRRLGFADQSVVTLDPACGSGSYPLAIVDAAATTAVAQRGAAGPAQISAILARNLISFELMPGPYAVAHLRIGQRIAEISGKLTPPEVRVYLTDTLDDPAAVPEAIPLWGDVELLAEERRRAQSVKRDENVMVAIGNPPYRRVEKSSGEGGWVVSSGTKRSLFDDILEPANMVTIFSHIASLYNLYVYFWRWAIWKVFEAQGEGPAVVSFITASSWLTGPGFVGLRQLAQSLGDEIWVCDLGGDNRGTCTEENVFAIKTPVAIVTVIRDGPTSRESLPRVMYWQVTGNRSEKLAAVRDLPSPLRDPVPWTELAITRLGDELVPAAGDFQWHSMPLLTSIFPWQHPGVKANRTWPISPSREVLGRRWDSLLEQSTEDSRAEAFVTPKTGRNIHTRVQDLPPLRALQKSTPPHEIIRYSFRSFDRQWIIKDPRLLALDRPPLWNSASDQQIYLSTMTAAPLGAGPTMTMATSVPDLHHFSGRGSKDVIPLYRDAAASQPNLTEGLLEVIGSELRKLDPLQENPLAEDLAAYVYALLSCPGYYNKFAEALTTPGPRVPLSGLPTLFKRASTLGRDLLWLHSFGQRCVSRNRPDAIPRHPDVSWVDPVKELPESMREVSYNPWQRELHIGTGTITGVREEVWSFTVSGWPVVQRWIAYRTKKGYGRAATRPGLLDRIRPKRWEDDWNAELLELLTVLTLTVERFEEQASLLDEICQGPLIGVDKLPEPAAYEREEPRFKLIAVTVPGMRGAVISDSAPEQQSARSTAADRCGGPSPRRTAAGAGIAPGHTAPTSRGRAQHPTQ